MLRVRVIPVLLLKNGGLVKTIRFRDPKYVGDPINAVRIFNEKEVDELVLLNIDRDQAPIPFEQLEEIASEAFMPLGYGGGFRNIEDIYRVLRMGFEKVILNTATVENEALIVQAAKEVGSQSVVACIDVKQNIWGKYDVLVDGGTRKIRRHPVQHARRMEELGAGEIIIQSIDRDGTRTGYDINLLGEIVEEVNVPVVACGGADSIDDFAAAVRAGASAVAAGSCFVFYGKHRAVLISYPDYGTLEQSLNNLR